MKKISTISRLCVAALLLLLACTTSFAQTGRVYRYTNATFSGTFSTITSSYTGAPGPGDDGYTTTTIPFAFNFDSVAYSANSTIYLGWNGTVGFVAPYSGGYHDPIGYLTNSTDPGVLSSACGFACDLYSYTTTPYGLYYTTQGSAPNRVFVVEYANWCTFINTSTYTSTQWKFYEGTNIVEILFKDHSKYMGPPEDGDGGGTGLNGTSAVSGDYLRASGTTQAMTTTPSTDFRFTPPLNQPPTEFSLTPKSLNYGAVGAGGSLTLYDTVKCLGPNQLKFIAWSITGSANYTIVSGPKLTDSVAAGAYVVFGIQFAPTLSGNLNATFNITTNAKDSATQTCTLNGVGAAAGVQYSFPYNGVYPANTLFHHVAKRFGDSATQSVVVQSNGVAALNFSSISFVGLQASMYTITHLPPNPLAAGATDSIVVKFKPFIEGRPDATLIINTNAINNPSDTVSMWGVGVLAHLVVTPQVGTIGDGTQAAIMQFDSVAMGDSVCQTLTLHSTGTDTLIIKKQIITYGDYDFTFSLLSGSDLILPPDASKTVNICFKPLEQGLRFASVRFYTNIPLEYPSNVDSSQFLVQVSGTGVPFGHLALTGVTQDSAMLGVSNCIDDTIWNNGSAPLTVNSATVSGLSASDFTLGGFIPKTIVPAKGYIPVTLCFKTANRGAEQDTLIVMASSNEMNMTQVLAVTGVGQQACASASPNPVSFPLTLAGTMSADSCITVTNCGDVAEMFTATLGAGTSTAYALTQATTAMVAPGGTSTICLHFSPDTIGAMAGTIIVTPSVDGATNAKTLTLSATGGGAWIAPTGQPATTAAGSSSTFTVTLTNNGNWPWTPGTGTITGANKADYTVTTQVTPTTIAAGGTGTMTITFAPATMGTSTAQLAFASESPVSFGPNLPYPLSGTVTAFQSVAEHTAQDGFVLGASYPNPTNGTASAFVTLPYDAKVRVTVMNLDGSVAATAFDGMMNQGDHTIALDAKQLASGTYFYQLESGAVRLTRAMIVTH